MNATDPAPSSHPEFLAPLGRAWRRMQELLFRPFHLGTWLTVGLAAWLVRLGEGSVGGGGGGGGWGGDGSDVGSNGSFPSWDSWGWEEWGLAAGLLGLVGCILLFVLVLVVLILWLNGRSHFIFLDNVVRNRAAFKEPWEEYKREGNSLFLWRLAFLVVCIFLFLLVALPGIFLLISAISADASPVPGILLIVLPAILLALAVAYVDLFLTDFVVPVMYQRRLRTNDAWRVFLPLLRRHAGSFFLWGVWIFALHFAVGLAIVIVGLLTCCIGLVLVIIPYVGTVLLLPLHVTYRAYSLEFLSQIDPEMDLPPLPEPPSAERSGSTGTVTGSEPETSPAVQHPVGPPAGSGDTSAPEEAPNRGEADALGSDEAGDET